MGASLIAEWGHVSRPLAAFSSFGFLFVHSSDAASENKKVHMALRVGPLSIYRLGVKGAKLDNEAQTDVSCGNTRVGMIIRQRIQLPSVLHVQKNKPGKTFC